LFRFVYKAQKKIVLTGEWFYFTIFGQGMSLKNNILN
jgi:hypothetical protein